MSGTFVIVSMGRTGSTMLVGLLNSHPDIECQGEIISPHGRFSKCEGMSRIQFLEQQAYETSKPIKGFKMPFDWAIQQAGVFEDLKKLGYMAIKLTRTDPVAHLVSSKLAHANMDYSSQCEHAIQSVTISPWEFVHFTGYKSAAEKCLDAMIGGFSTFSIKYENLPDPGVQRELLHFLGGRPCDLALHTVRSRTKPIHEVVTNYAELSRFFEGTPYASLWPRLERTGMPSAAAATE